METPEKCRILLVDDNEANRYALARLLKRSGYEVVEVGTGGEALKEMEMGPDLVILDVRLPDINGLEVSRRIRLDPRTRMIPILQTSATFTMTTDRIAGLDSGADGYLASPVEPGELLAHVRMLLRLKSTQEALAQSNSRLKSVLSNIVETFFALDAECKFVEVNPAAEKMFARPAVELLGRHIWREFPQMRDAVLGQKCIQATDSREPNHFEAAMPLPDGHWWEGHVYPYEDRLEVYLRDISERKNAEMRLRHFAEELSRARDELAAQNERLEMKVQERTARLQETVSDLETFSYSITHDMRAPLRAMQGFSGLLLESYRDVLDEEGVQYLERIASSANRLDLLIRDVLSYSKVVRTEMTLVPVDLQKLITDIISDYPGLKAPHANIEVRQQLPNVLGNQAFLTQVFSNLLNNAAKFTKPGVTPDIEISWEPLSNQNVRVRVKDNGIGIPAEHQTNIFKLFQRANNTYPGTGIGLAVVKKAVERMGGQVGLESSLDEGSTFWVDLMLATS